MRNSTFVKVAAGIVALGLSYGGVFGAGTLLGRSQAPEGASAQSVVALPTATAQAAQPSTLTFTPDDVARFREQLSQQFGGQVPPQLEGVLGQFSDGGTIDLTQLGGQGGLQGLPGGAGAPGQRGALRQATGTTGTITAVTGQSAILDTTQGPLNVTFDQSTAVQVISSAETGSLKAGDTVTVRGQRLADGTIVAAVITLSATQ